MSQTWGEAQTKESDSVPSGAVQAQAAGASVGATSVWIVAWVLACLLGWIASARAQGFDLNPGLGSQRLIETAPGERRWMGEGEIASLIEANHQRGQCGGFMDVTASPEVDYATVESRAFSGRRLPGQIQFDAVVDPLLAQVSATRLLGHVRHLSSYPTRFYRSRTGVEAMQWVAEQFRQIARFRTDVEVTLFQHSGYPQPSVIARIRGAGPRARETVILGGHGDSVHVAFGGVPTGGAAPGADDNASGTASVMEAFQILVESGYVPDRTIEFMVYAAEELGLLGSQDIAQAYRRQGRQVVAVMQLDMTLFPGRDRTPTLTTDFTDRELTDFTARLLEHYIRVRYATEACGYACSDHASWTRSGFPAVFPVEARTNASNPNIHTPRDTIEAGLDFEYGTHFAKLAIAFAVELSAKPSAVFGPDWPF